MRPVRTVLRTANTAAAACLLPAVSFDRPIFLLGAWRSGSSLLSDVINEHCDAWSCPRECDEAWWRVFPLTEPQWTDEVTERDAQQPGAIGRLRRALLALAIKRRGAKGFSYWPQAIAKRSRYVEKTIANAFHLRFLKQAFPNASYVHLIRDPRENVSSMIEAWEKGRLARRRIPGDRPTELPWWTGPWAPGWDEQLGRPIREIAAWSWIEHNERILTDIDEVGLRESTMFVRYEDVLSDPDAVLDTVVAHTGLTRRGARSARETIGRASWSTVSAPKKEKWKEINREAIEAIEPMVLPMHERLTRLADGRAGATTTENAGV